MTAGSRLLFGVFGIVLASIPAHASLLIIPTFDVSITSDPNAVAIEAAINAGINQIESSFSDPITVAIKFQEGGGLGSSNTSIFQIAYSTFRAALLADRKSADDTTALAVDAPSQATSPVDGQANMWLTAANLDALGISHGGVPFDGTITLNTSLTNLDRTTIDPGKYDLQSVAMHEMDEVLGLGSGLNLPTAFPRLSRPQDLFRYSAAGVRSFDTSGTATSYLSIDGGATDLVNFNQNGGADYGDFLGGGIPKVQDAFGSPGIIPTYGVEIRDLDVIGFDLAAPEPGTLLLFVGSFLILLSTRAARLHPKAVLVRRANHESKGSN